MRTPLPRPSVIERILLALSEQWENKHREKRRDGLSQVTTYVVVHISRQQGQPLLTVGQDLRLETGADFLQRINEPGHFAGPDPPI